MPRSGVKVCQVETVLANVLGLKRLQNKTTSTFPLPTLGTPSPLHTTCGVEEPASVVVKFNREFEQLSS